MKTKCVFYSAFCILHWLAGFLRGHTGGHLDLATQILQSRVELLVLELLDLGRLVLALNDLGGVQMLVEIHALLGRQLDDLIGGDAPHILVLAGRAGLVKVLLARPPEGGRRHLDVAAIELQDVLHAALAVAAFADDTGAIVILQTGRHNLAAAGAVTVDQANHRETKHTAARPAIDLLLRYATLADAYDHAVIDVQVGNLDGAIEQSTRIET